MGQLNDTLEKIEAIIEVRKLDRFKTRGAIAIKIGFPLGLITPGTPDDADKLAKLKAAAATVLGTAF